MKRFFTGRTNTAKPYLAAHRGSAAFLLMLAAMLLGTITPARSAPPAHGGAVAEPTVAPVPAPPVAIERFIDEGHAKEQVFQTGYHVRVALRGWLETPPSSVFGESIGINFGNVPRAHIDAAMAHLARNGFRHVRIEVGWVALDLRGDLQNEDIKAALRAAKKHRLRPLILLNSHEGVPCPVETTRVTLLRPAKAGDRSLYVSHEDAKRVVDLRTGLSHQYGHYRAANVLVISRWDFGGAAGGHTRLDLSQPLEKDLPEGPLELQTLLAAPLFNARPASNPEATDLLPIQMDSLHRWIGLYVGPLSKQLEKMLGKGGWDYEVTNELMFGAAWFSATDQYIDEAAKKQLGWVWNRSLLDELVRRTVDFVHANHPGVATVNGSTSQNIWSTAGTETTTEMHSRHFYVPRIVKDGITYWYPEQTASSDYDGINTMALDLLPFNHNQFGRNNHSWNRDGTQGPASTLAQTEGGSVTQFAVEAGLTLSEADHYYLRAKWEIRQLLFFANKGGINKDGRGTRYYLYTLREGDKVNYHQIARPELFQYLEASGGVYPPTVKEAALTAKTFEVIKRTRSYLPIRPIIKGAPRSLTVERITERHNNVQIADGPHGTLHNRDVLAVLPFQTGDDSFAVGLYVQTLNLAREYHHLRPMTAWEATSLANQVPGTLPPTRFDLPEEEYEIRLGGLKAWREGISEARLVDLMTGRTQAVKPDATGTFRVKLTDYPKLLVLKKL